jgi:hypothetical protein
MSFRVQVSLLICASPQSSNGDLTILDPDAEFGEFVAACLKPNGTAIIYSDSWSLGGIKKMLEKADCVVNIFIYVRVGVRVSHTHTQLYNLCVCVCVQVEKRTGMLVCAPDDPHFSRHTRAMACSGYHFVVAHGSPKWYKRRVPDEGGETMKCAASYFGNVWDNYCRVKTWPVSGCIQLPVISFCVFG